MGGNAAATARADSYTRAAAAMRRNEMARKNIKPRLPPMVI